MDAEPKGLLAGIDDPADLRRLPVERLPQLCAEIRETIVDTISRTGGHLAASLGAVELAVALHYVFHTPEDRLIWDVGHQSYAHKLLTGRRDRFSTIRQDGGISGFPRRAESVYDVFGTGHSSTSISAALGMAIAARAQGKNRRTVALIGDGAMTAGMVFEAMNCAGVEKDLPLLVVLNDNEMSISKPVGALSEHLVRLMSGNLSKVRDLGKRILKPVPSLFELARRFEEHAKGMLLPSTLFEEFGFNYFGPVDGHNVVSLVATLRNLSQLDGPVVLHVVTEKGHGYAPAEHDPTHYHGTGSFDPKVGIVEKAHADNPSYTEVFGQWLCDIAAIDPKVVGITPAMREGSGMVAFSEKYPDRFFDVAIAEQHAATFAGGLAAEGMKPVAAFYSTFAQRAFDQIVHDVALQDLPVIFPLDRGGIVGNDGATHHGAFDLSFLRCIPNLVIMAPSDENELRQMLFTAYACGKPAVVRYPRGKGPGVQVAREMRALPIGKARVQRRGSRVAFLAFGSRVAPCLEAGSRLDATVVDMRFVKPVDTELVVELARSHELLVTVEENAVAGGAGSAVLEALAAAGVRANVLQLGIPDRFIEHGSTARILADLGLDADGIERAARERLARLGA